MSFSDVLKKSFLEGFVSTDLTTTDICVTMLVTACIGLYIYFIYRIMSQKTFYSKSFNISLVALAMITAGIILAIQSSVVISLGMVGALSIVRFRTAIKNPMDLVYLFWSISVGIVCGAGLFEVALIVSVFVTVAVVVLEFLPAVKEPKLLVINAKDPDEEDAIMEVVKKYVKRYKVKSRNLTSDNMDLLLLVSIKEKDAELVKEIKKLSNVNTVSLMSHDGEVGI
ncbi:MAG: DUF4956 domain-containing protein [Lachnospiraceae bacterium]|nr:DUF4956 domain-containing protein [Lachnospiraceae bacterium]MBQ7833954.1 DUF4956 domain-containing protein [Lachnospiraceae bacterium]